MFDELDDNSAGNENQGKKNLVICARAPRDGLAMVFGQVDGQEQQTHRPKKLSTVPIVPPTPASPPKVSPAKASPTRKVKTNAAFGGPFSCGACNAPSASDGKLTRDVTLSKSRVFDATQASDAPTEVPAPAKLEHKPVTAAEIAMYEEKAMLAQNLALAVSRRNQTLQMSRAAQILEKKATKAKKGADAQGELPIPRRLLVEHTKVKLCLYRYRTDHW